MGRFVSSLLHTLVILIQFILVAASLVPAMQKGNETARLAHIGLNCANIALFAWQVGTGIEIMLKVWEKAPW